MNESGITAIESMPQLTPLEAIERRNGIVRFVKAALKDGTDYGIIPGTEKKTLYKPGAEKLCTLFGLSWRLVPVDQIMDWTGKDHDGEPFFWFSYRCELRHGGIYVGESEGSCSSWEKKYRYRDAKRKCPECHREVIFKSKPRPNDPPGKKMGWYCYSKVGGCGAQFPADDKRITEQTVGQVKNPDIHDLVNTIQKMAEKRAFVGSTVLAVNASEFFSGDMDEIDYTESELEERAAAKKTETPEEIQAKMQSASKSVRGDQGDIDLGPEWPPTEYPTNSADAKIMTDRPEIVPEPGHESPMPEPPELPAQSASAKFKRATISAAIRRSFVDWCGEWIKNDARAAEYSADGGGGPNMYHILGRVGKFGIAEVTAENVEAVKVKLQEHIEKESTK